jgi:hypothetical protein
VLHVLTVTANGLQAAADLGPERKDVTSGILGASAALGGLTLVFLGIVIAGYRSYDSDTMKAVRKPYRTAALRLLITFGASLVSVVLSIAWLAAGGGSALYVIALVIFGLQVLLIAVFAPLTVYRALLE